MINIYKHIKILLLDTIFVFCFLKQLKTRIIFNFLFKMSKQPVLSNVKELLRFVPKHNIISWEDKSNFIKFLTNYENILVLTGAGVSTESGIPDYRSQEVGLYTRNYKPITYSKFMKNEESRKRYWLRNFVGWPRFSESLPNKTHYGLTNFQLNYNKLLGIVTQNVDGLHSKAGNHNVTELHGNAFWVKCVECKNLIFRHDFQKTLKSLNPNINYNSVTIRPDGDVEISNEICNDFLLPDCEHCGGILKPAIVFFGENVPSERVKKIEQLVEKCDALLILGTSLSTLSSYRIVEQAYDLCKFICIVNIGPTRADKLADILIQAKCSDAFSVLDFHELI